MAPPQRRKTSIPVTSVCKTKGNLAVVGSSCFFPCGAFVDTSHFSFFLLCPLLQFALFQLFGKIAKLAKKSGSSWGKKNNKPSIAPAATENCQQSRIIAQGSFTLQLALEWTDLYSQAVQETNKVWKILLLYRLSLLQVFSADFESVYIQDLI